jgi:hypothetical protein
MNARIILAEQKVFGTRLFVIFLSRIRSVGSCDDVDDKPTIPHSQCGLDGFSHTASDIGFDDKPIDNKLNVVSLISIKSDFIRQLVYLSIDPRTNESGFSGIRQVFTILATTTTHNRS